MEITLGWKVKDSVTGMIEIAVAKCIYLNGCVQYQVVPRSEKNVLYRNLWVDQDQLTRVSDGILAKPKAREYKRNTDRFSPGGGDRSHPND
jgi:hypothetical protein